MPDNLDKYKLLAAVVRSRENLWCYSGAPALAMPTKVLAVHWGSNLIAAGIGADEARRTCRPVLMSAVAKGLASPLSSVWLCPCDGHTPQEAPVIAW